MGYASVPLLFLIHHHSLPHCYMATQLLTKPTTNAYVYIMSFLFYMFRRPTAIFREPRQYLKTQCIVIQFVVLGHAVL